MKLEVALIAGSRPELLQRTSESFSHRLFSNFSVVRIVANVDPIFGSADVGAGSSDATIQVAQSAGAKVFIMIGNGWTTDALREDKCGNT